MSLSKIILLVTFSAAFCFNWQVWFWSFWYTF